MTHDHEAQNLISSLVAVIEEERSLTPTKLRGRLISVKEQPTRGGVRIRIGVCIETNIAKSDLRRRFMKSNVTWSSGRDTATLMLQEGDAEDTEFLLDKAVLEDFLPQEDVQLETYDFQLAALNAYRDPLIAADVFDSYVRLQSPSAVGVTELIDVTITQNLGPSQRGALTLINQSIAWLWGPPGTGKTYSSAVLLAAYLTKCSQGKVLVLSLTNQAVNEMCIRVDLALQNAGCDDLRSQVTRYGPGGADLPQHLLPDAGDNTGLASKSALSNRNRHANYNEHPPGKVTRLFAMTCHRALVSLNTLRGLGPFDLMLVEEASQSSLAHLLPLLSLAKSCVFAGDPEQLSPVSKGRSNLSRQFMGESPFVFMPRGEDSPFVTMLNDQRRMGPSICALVSSIFYEGKLVTAPECLVDPKWLQERRIVFGSLPEGAAMVLATVEDGIADSTKRNSRQSSVDVIVRLVNDALAQGFNPKHVLIISPFNDQVNAIRHALIAAHLPFQQIVVTSEIEQISTTVHDSQGNEALVVIFDPVNGLHPFLLGEQARKIFNVSFSRAIAKLILTASERDLQHPILSKFGEHAELTVSIQGTTTPMNRAQPVSAIVPFGDSIC